MHVEKFIKSAVAVYTSVGKSGGPVVTNDAGSSSLRLITFMFGLCNNNNNLKH